jgi:hypothetical protein
VLTDRDFGRAYLAEGWATTFLRAMYAQHDVLFIGYSHSEPVLRYLARGLSGRTARYAFDAADGDLSAWRALGITPIPYPGGDATDRHAALRVAAIAWAERTQMGYTDHEAMIREACGGAPPLDASMADYVRQALRDPATARFFSAYAVGIEWLAWIKDELEFRALFGVGELSPSSFELAEWFATKFVLQHPEVALSLLQELGGKMVPPLWLACARQLWVASPRPAPAVFAKWVSALIESSPTLQGNRFLEYLLRVCRWPEDRGIALLLFAHLTDPHPEFEPRLAFLGETTPGVRVSIGIRGDDTALRDSWVNYFLPNIDEFAEQLEPIVAGQLVRAHELLKAVAEADDRWDPTSYLRPRIEG